MVGVEADAVLAKQKYELETISDNMFSESKEEKKKVMIPLTPLPRVTIDQLWTTIFADGSTFLKAYHDKRNEKDLVVGNWMMAPDRGSGYRFVSLTTIVEVPRAGTETPLNEAHRFCYVRTAEGTLRLVYHISSQTPKVPFGTSFRTEALCVVTADNESAPCSIAFWGKCRKMSFQYGPIQFIAEPRALREMTEAYKVMVELIAETMTGEKLEVTAAPQAEPERGAGGGGGEVDQTFQTAVLGLGIFVAIMTFFVLRSVAKTARATSRIVSLPPTMWVEGFLARNMESTAGSRGGRKTALEEPSLPSSVYTFLDSIESAALEAGLQSLRYRYMEQHNSLQKAESSIRWLWWAVILQWVVLVGFIVLSLRR